MIRTLIILIFLMLWLPACQQARLVPPANTAVLPTAATKPAATSVPATAISQATVSPDAAAVIPEAPSTATQSSGLTPLFDIAPNDLSIYARGLVAAEQDALNEQSGAPVYHIAIEIAPSMDALEGRQTVTLINQEDVPLEEIYFHLHANTLDGATAVSDVVVGGAPVTPVMKGATLRVPLPSPLGVGETTTIDMRFKTTVPTDIGRNYGVLAYYDDILALAHFYPMLAVYDGEGWNITAPDVQGDLTYSDAAFYLVRVTAPADEVLVGAGSVIVEESGDGVQSVTYALGPARDFYLAAGDFTLISDIVGETTINSYAPADLADGAAIALDVAAEALAGFNERLPAYPYSELDIVTTPTSALGIEYPGLIVGTLRMYDIDGETEGGIPLVAYLESTTAHEVAHQWFYNLAGNDQLDEPWLDEALASYSTYRYYANRYGQDAGNAYFETFFSRWDRVERADIPIGMPVNEYQDAEYGAIVYGRGAIFVRELEEAMGRATFDAFLRDYVQQFRWEEGDTVAFRALAEEHCGCDLGPLFDEWIYE